MDQASIQKAREAGYTDDEIINHLSKTDERVAKALGHGYAPTEIIAHLSGSAATPAAEQAAAPENVVESEPQFSSYKPRPFGPLASEEERAAEMRKARLSGGTAELVDALVPDAPSSIQTGAGSKSLATLQKLTRINADLYDNPELGVSEAKGFIGDVAGKVDTAQKVSDLVVSDESVPRIIAGIATEIGVSEGSKIAGARIGARRGAQGAAVGYVTGAVLGGAAGSIAAQEVEGRDKISWGRVIADSFLNLVLPGAEAKSAPRVLRGVAKATAKAPVISSAAIGAAASGGTNLLEQAIEGEGVDGGEATRATVVGGGLGGGLGLVGKILGKVFNKGVGDLAQKGPDHLEKLVAKGDPDAIAYLNFLLEDVPSEKLPALSPKDFVQSLIAKGKAQLAPSKVLTEDVMRAVRRAENAPEAQKQLGDVLGKRIDRAVTEAVAKHGPEVEEQIWKFTAGELDAPPKQLGAAVDDLVEAKRQVYALQTRVLANHYEGKRLLERPVKEAIESSLNKGNYLTRSYRFFEDPLYNPPKGSFDKAVKALVDSGVDQGAAKQYLLELQARRAGNAADVISYMHSSNSGVLKSKNHDLPLEVRKYLGEYTMPGEKLAATQSKLSKMVEYDDADAAISKSLLDNGLAKTRDGAGDGWVPLKMRSSDAQVNGEKLFVEPHTMRALNEVYGVQEAAGGSLASRAVNDIYHAAVAASKATKVLWNPPSWMVQIYGNLAGNINSLNNPFRGLARGVLAGASTFSKSSIADKIPLIRRVTSRAQIKTLLRNKRYQELGLVDKSLAFNDFMRSAKTQGGPVSTLVRAMFAPFGKGYSGFDTALRVVGYENFKKTLMKATRATTPEQIAKVEEEAAAIINDIYPNYAYLNNSVKTLSQHGLTSQFSAFSMELMRNQYNHVSIAKKLASGSYADDLAARTGLQIADPSVLRRKGAYMFSGLAAMHGAGYAAIKAYNRTEGGMSEEEEMAWRETGAMPWDKESNTVLKKGDDGDTVYSTNASYLLPHAQISGWMGAALRGEDPRDAVGKFVEAVVGDIGGEGSFAMRTFISAMSNTDIQTKRDITYRVDTGGRVAEIMDWAMKDAFEPGFQREVRKARDQSFQTTMARQMGLRINTNSFRTGLQIKSKNIKDAFTNMASEMAGLGHKLEDKTLTPEQYEAEYQRLNTSYRQQSEALAKHYKNSRVWGIKDEEIVTLMKGAGVGSTKILDAMQGIVRDLPKTKEVTPRSIWEKDFAGLSMKQQTAKLRTIDNKVMALAIKDIIVGEARKKATGETPLDALYKAIPSVSGERARRILDDLSQSANPSALETRFIKTGVIDRNTAYHMRLLRQKK